MSRFVFDRAAKLMRAVHRQLPMSSPCGRCEWTLMHTAVMPCAASTMKRNKSAGSPEDVLNRNGSYCASLQQRDAVTL
jgi:hypothetical protein